MRAGRLLSRKPHRRRVVSRVDHSVEPSFTPIRKPRVRMDEAELTHRNRCGQRFPLCLENRVFVCSVRPSLDPIPAPEGRAIRRKERLVQRRLLQLFCLFTNTKDSRLLLDVNDRRVLRLVLLNDPVHTVLDGLPGPLCSLHHKCACCTSSSRDLLGELALLHFVGGLDRFSADLERISNISSAEYFSLLEFRVGFGNPRFQNVPPSLQIRSHSFGPIFDCVCSAPFL